MKRRTKATCSSVSGERRLSAGETRESGAAREASAQMDGKQTWRRWRAGRRVGARRGAGGPRAAHVRSSQTHAPSSRQHLDTATPGTAAQRSAEQLAVTPLSTEPTPTPRHPPCSPSLRVSKARCTRSSASSAVMPYRWASRQAPTVPARPRPPQQCTYRFSPASSRPASSDSSRRSLGKGGGAGRTGGMGGGGVSWGGGGCGGRCVGQRLLLLLWRAGCTRPPAGGDCFWQSTTSVASQAGRGRWRPPVGVWHAQVHNGAVAEVQLDAGALHHVDKRKVGEGEAPRSSGRCAWQDELLQLFCALRCAAGIQPRPAPAAAAAPREPTCWYAEGRRRGGR